MFRSYGDFIPRVRYGKWSKTYKPNGKRECERRVKQMFRIMARQNVVGVKSPAHS